MYIVPWIRFLAKTGSFPDLKRGKKKLPLWQILFHASLAKSNFHFSIINILFLRLQLNRQTCVQNVTTNKKIQNITIRTDLQQLETNSDTDSVKSETSNDNCYRDLFGDHSYSKPFVNTAAESRETCPNMMIQGEYEEALANNESTVYQEIQATGQNILKEESLKE